MPETATTPKVRFTICDGQLEDLDAMTAMSVTMAEMRLGVLEEILDVADDIDDDTAGRLRDAALASTNGTFLRLPDPEVPDDWQDRTVTQLRALARQIGAHALSSDRRDDVITAITRQLARVSEYRHFVTRLEALTQTTR